MDEYKEIIEDLDKLINLTRFYCYDKDKYDEAINTVEKLKKKISKGKIEKCILKGCDDIF